MAYVLGLDLGTSALKGLLVDKSGTVIATATENYPLETPMRGYSEQDPKYWYEASIEVLRKIIDLVPDAATKIEGISFSGQMHSLVVLDENGEPLRNAILWNDVRTTKQCERIVDVLDDDLINITRNKALEGFTLPKVLWIQDNEPEIWEQTRMILLPKDYLRYKLTGTYEMDYSDAAGTLLLDIEKKQWSKPILETFNIDSGICPKLVNATDKTGHLKEEIAKDLGIENNIPIFAGGADNACGAVGAGIVQENQAMASIGTSGVFLSYEESGQKHYDGHLHFFNHVIPNKYYSMGVTLAAGNSLTWFKNQFASNETFEELLENIQAVPVGSVGLLFTPYISGERTPYTDSNIRGSFIGIDIAHTRDHFARSVLEGVTFSLRDSQELMREYSGKVFDEIVSVGGGAKNKEWLQIQADIFNTPVVTLETEQGPGLGAAMIAAVGTGWFVDFNECADVFVNYQEKIIPNKENVEKYEEIYKVYKTIYEATKGLNDQLTKI